MHGSVVEIFGIRHIVVVKILEQKTSRRGIVKVEKHTSAYGQVKAAGAILDVMVAAADVIPTHHDNLRGKVAVAGELLDVVICEAGLQQVGANLLGANDDRANTVGVAGSAADEERHAARGAHRLHSA